MNHTAPTSDAGGILDDGAAVGLIRANLYRFLAVATLPPDDERFAVLYDDGFRQVVVEATRCLGREPCFHPEVLGPGEIDPATVTIDGLLPAVGDGLAGAYRGVFGHSISKDCPPYELEYCSTRDINFRSQRLADIAGFYRAFGLERAENARDRIDHLSFEAEFMQIVVARELYARRGGLGEDKVVVCRRAQRDFFVEHLGWWLPAFGAQLAERTGTLFYRSLGRLAGAMVAAERAVLGLPRFTELPTVHPDTYEPEGSCFDCGLDETGTSARSRSGDGVAGIHEPASGSTPRRAVRRAGRHAGGADGPAGTRTAAADS